MAGRFNVIFQIKKLPIRIRIALQMSMLFIILFTLFRVVFFLFNYSEINTLSMNYLLNSFFIGLRFDARLTVLILLPFFSGLTPVLNGMMVEM